MKNILLAAILAAFSTVAIAEDKAATEAAPAVEEQAAAPAAEEAATAEAAK